jgi:hypothetical protein
MFVEDPRHGQPSTSTNNDHVERVGDVVHGDHSLTVREGSDKVGISIGSYQQLVTEILKVRHFSAKLVLCLLAADQKENHVENTQELLSNANGNEIFLKNVITERRHVGLLV